MRYRSLLALSALTLIAPACRSAGNEAASSPAPMAAPAVNAVGRWSLVIEAQGQPLELLVDLRKVTETEYAGSMSSQMFPTTPLTKATLTGDKLMLQVPSPTGDLATFNLVIAGDLISGDWSMPGMGSGVNGRRVP